jgi:hypothetical protein
MRVMSSYHLVVESVQFGHESSADQSREMNLLILSNSFSCLKVPIFS